MNRTLPMLFLVSMLTALSSAKAETNRPYQGNVIGSLLGAPYTIDPVLASLHADSTLISLVFDTLYKTDKDGRVLPHLASGFPTYNEEGTEAKIHLLEGIRFHRGGVLTPKDVVESLRRVEKYGWALAGITTISIEGKDIVLKSAEPILYLLERLSLTQTAITRGGVAPTFRKADGTGPFRILSFRNRFREVRLRRFEQHFNGPTFLETLRLRWYLEQDAEARAYESGTVQYSLRGEVAFTGHQPKFETSVVESPAAVLKYLGLGTRFKSQVAFRRALSLAIGRRSLSNIGTGETVFPTLSPVLDTLDAPAIPMDADETRARFFLEKVKRNDSLEDLTVAVDRTRPGDRAVAEKIVASLFRIGQKATIIELSSAEFFSNTKTGSADLFIGEVAFPSHLPLMQLLASIPNLNDRRRVLTSKEDYQSGIRWFSKELPVVPLYHRTIRVHHQRNVRGLSFTKSGAMPLDDLFVFGGVRKNRR